jgi:uncharacterized protein YecT (DUF1311 family)
MKKSIWFLFLCTALAQANNFECNKAGTMLEINDCMAEKLTATHHEMQKYLSTSIQRHQDDAIVADSIKQAQRAWMKYMELHCDSVFSVWREGSIRNIMTLDCQINLTQQRTHELWLQFLRSAENDSVLPRPEFSDQ